MRLCGINTLMSTIRELITGALRLINVVQAGEVPTSDDMDVSFRALNNMLDNWSTERLTIFSMNYYDFYFDPGKFTYTLGPGGDWSITRPMELLSMYVNYTSLNIGMNAIDIPMEKLTWEQYSLIGVKNVQGMFPIKFYEDGNNPLRTVYVWPVPLTIQKARLWLWQPLIDSATIDDVVNFPKGYERALRFALAVELASEFGKAVPDTVSKIARNSKSLLKRLNSNPQIMRGDVAIASTRPSLFNYITGDTIPSNT